MTGSRGEDRLEDGAGDDLLRGGSQQDVGDGGDGTDTCVNVEKAVSCEE